MHTVQIGILQRATCLDITYILAAIYHYFHGNLFNHINLNSNTIRNSDTNLFKLLNKNVMMQVPVK